MTPRAARWLGSGHVDEDDLGVFEGGARLVANEWGVLQRALVDGLGIGPLVKQLARADLERGRLEQVLPEYTLDGGGLYAIYPSRHHLSGKVRAFVDFMVEKITSMELEDSASHRPL